MRFASPWGVGGWGGGGEPIHFTRSRIIISHLVIISLILESLYLFRIDFIQSRMILFHLVSCLFHSFKNFSIYMASYMFRIPV